MTHASSGRLLKFALGGAAGGFFAFLLLNPSIAAEELAGTSHNLDSLADAVAQLFHHAMTFGAVVGLAIGASLILVEELATRNAARILLRTAFAALLGLLCGAAGGFVGQFAFSLLLLGGVIIARAIGWCLLGAAAGLCPGTVAGSPRRTRQGMVGGLVGGGIGGILFDLLALTSGSGTASRAVGLTILGAIVGFSVALVEELAKECWITVLSGSKEGQSFILTKPATSIGRSELADIPLFGDPDVLRIHATLQQSGNVVQAIAAAGAALQVNGSTTTSAVLGDGDLLALGRHRLRLHLRVRGTAPARSVSSPTVSPPAIANRPVFQQPALSRIEIVEGPHAPNTVLLSPGTLTVGRDTACSLPLPADHRASRTHAVISGGPTGWVINDLGSTNGLFVNGQRVDAHQLASGDVIALGETVLRIS